MDRFLGVRQLELVGTISKSVLASSLSPVSEWGLSSKNWRHSWGQLSPRSQEVRREGGKEERERMRRGRKRRRLGGRKRKMGGKREGRGMEGK